MLSHVGIGVPSHLKPVNSWPRRVPVHWDRVQPGRQRGSRPGRVLRQTFLQEVGKAAVERATKARRAMAVILKFMVGCVFAWMLLERGLGSC